MLPQVDEAVTTAAAPNSTHLFFYLTIQSTVMHFCQNHCCNYSPITLVELDSTTI